MSEKDVKDASAGVLKDLKRFQLEKEEDLKRYMVWTMEFTRHGASTDTRLGRIRPVSHGLGTEEP